MQCENNILKEQLAGLVQQLAVVREQRGKATALNDEWRVFWQGAKARHQEEIARASYELQGRPKPGEMQPRDLTELRQQAGLRTELM